jgi:hypothetical protein
LRGQAAESYLPITWRPVKCFIAPSYKKPGLGRVFYTHYRLSVKLLLGLLTRLVLLTRLLVALLATLARLLRLLAGLLLGPALLATLLAALVLLSTLVRIVH